MNIIKKCFLRQHLLIRVKEISQWIKTFSLHCFLVLFIMALPASNIYGQKGIIRFKRISIEDDLPQSTVNCIFQDRKGFMWFGTQDGLARYDGYKFKVFKPDPQDSNTISHNFVWCILQDEQGMIWIGTRGGGLNMLEPESGCIKRYIHDNNNPNSLSNDNVRAIYKDRFGILWIGTDGGGLNKFNPTNGYFTHYRHEKNKSKSLSNDKVTYIYEDHSGGLWIGTNGGGLNKLDRNTGFFIRFKHEVSNPSSLNNNKVKSIYEDRFNVLWIGTEGGGLDKFDQKTGGFIHYVHNPDDDQSLSCNEVKSIYEDTRGIMWIGTDGGGLNKFNRKTNKFEKYTHDAANPYSLSKDNIRSIYEDQSGLIWIGTRGGGLNIFNIKWMDFELHQHHAANPNSLSNNDVRTIFEDNTGILWIGTYNGILNEYNRKNGEFTHYKTENRDLSHNNIRCIYQENSDVLWIGTRDGLNKFDLKTKKFVPNQHIEKNLNSLNHKFISCIYKDSWGILWIGALRVGGGLHKFNPESGRFTYYNTDNSSLSHNDVRCIYQDSKDDLWIGTEGGGLNKFDREKETFSHFKHVASNNTSLSHNDVSSIYESTSGDLWIGTYGGGLNKLTERISGVFESYTEKNSGIPNNVVYGILEDNKGNLWLSTDRGISKFNPVKKTFRNYVIHDGLQCNEFNANAYFKNKDGKMFFGGIKGFNAFFPGKIKDDPYVPPIVITDFLIPNQSVPLKKAIHETAELTLNYKQTIFSFEFAALHYAAPERNKYRYKLEGWDNKWIDTDWRNRRATYTNLPAGDYVFKVQGSNKDGIWNMKSTSIKIKILPPWWKSWWAYILYALVGIAILYSFWSGWFQRKKMVYQRSLAHAEKMASLDTLVAGMAHEINNPNSSARTTNYNLERDLGKLKELLVELAGDRDEEILAFFDESFRMLFNHIDILKQSLIRIDDIVKKIKSYSQKEEGDMKPGKQLEVLQASLNLHKSTYHENVNFVSKFQANPEIQANSTELNQVYNYIIENSCHAIIEKQRTKEKKSKETITIKTKEEKKHLVISIQDTGSGMSRKIRKQVFDPFFTTKPVGEGKGLGLFFSYIIINKHQGRIKIESEEGSGTTVTLYLPLKRKEISIKKKVKINIKRRDKK